MVLRNLKHAPHARQARWIKDFHHLVVAYIPDSPDEDQGPFDSLGAHVLQAAILDFERETVHVIPPGMAAACANPFSSAFTCCSNAARASGSAFPKTDFARRTMGTQDNS